MEQKIVEQLTKNALVSKAIFANFLATHKNGTAFLRSFHLRPTSVGVTIVSTLPYAPMRGVSISSAPLAENLEKMLNALSKDFDKLLGVDERAAKEILSAIGFKERQSAGANGDREEDVQAAFIRGMLAKQPCYEGIQFVASELNLEDDNRFDVIGFKGDCLYIFELKNGRTTKAFEQVTRYLDHFNQNREIFISLLQNYPNSMSSTSQIQNVKGIAVMRYAHNSPESTWRPLICRHEVDAWFFKQSLDFQKLTM